MTENQGKIAGVVSLILACLIIGGSIGLMLRADALPPQNHINQTSELVRDQ